MLIAQVESQKPNTKVHTKPLPPDTSMQAFRLCALALRVPLFNQIARAVDLFCTPLPGARSRAKRALDSTTEPWDLQTVTHEGISYQAYVLGNPKTQPFLLCSHGWSSFGLCFGSWAKAAERHGYALVTFDHAAHGFSSGNRAHFPSFVAGIEAIRRHFGEPAGVIGHSFGAAALAVVAAQTPFRAPLVLLAPPADISSLIQTFFNRVGLASSKQSAFTEQLANLVNSTADSYRSESFARNIFQRTLVVHDRDDTEISWLDGASYARLVPGARIFSSSGLGHYRILRHVSIIQAALAHVSGFPVGEVLPGAEAP